MPRPRLSDEERERLRAQRNQFKRDAYNAARRNGSLPILQVTEPKPIDTKPESGNGHAGRMSDIGIELVDILQTIAERSAPTPTIDIDGLRTELTALVDERMASVKPREILVKIAETGAVKTVGRVHERFDRVLALVRSRSRKGFAPNILLVGPSGCGKTHLCEQVASAIGARFGFLSLSGSKPESALFGRYCPTGAAGSFEYHPAPFVEFYRNGGVFLLDEIDAADENMLLAINAALANGHCTLPTGECIARHAEFVCVGAANTFGNGADRQYVGRIQQDASVLDRFIAARVSVDYDRELERESSNPELCEWAHRVRDSLSRTRSRRIVSTRYIFDASDLIACGTYTLADAKRTLTLDWTAAELSAIGESAHA